MKPAALAVPPSSLHADRHVLAVEAVTAGDRPRHPVPTVAAWSGGQQVRAALACVLGNAVPPQLLIPDEPTHHLDLEAVEAL